MIQQAVAIRFSKNDSKRCLERKISKRCPERCHLNSKQMQNCNIKFKTFPCLGHLYFEHL